ncbi:MAG: hypothetical protein ACLPYS_11430 [Vulcanimicrobiaceae bacterium]
MRIAERGTRRFRSLGSRRAIVSSALLLALAALLAPLASKADTPHLPVAMPSASPAGPCAQGAVVALVDRPGLGRGVAVNGAPCVVPKGRVVLEAGYRNQVTSADGMSTLSTYPNSLVRFGIGAGNEVVVSPSLILSRRSGADLGGTFVPATGQQDAGCGFKHLFRDRPWIQDGLELFVTLPTGYPAGAFGFSAGIPTYLLGYSATVPLSSRIAISTTQNLLLNGAANGSGATARFFAYQPALGVSYALATPTTLLLQDQITTPTAPGSGTGNRAFIGIQQAVSPNVVLDVELEFNLLPTPGYDQHALGAGFAVLL